MGILVFCPNGHRLNVRAELAGEIGFVQMPSSNAHSFGKYAKSGERFVEGVSRTAEERPKNDEDGGRLPDENRPGRDEPVEAKPVVNETGTNYSTEPPVEEIIRQVAVADPAERKANSAGGPRMRLRRLKCSWMVNVNGQEYGPATIEVVHSGLTSSGLVLRLLFGAKGGSRGVKLRTYFLKLRRFSKKLRLRLTILLKMTCSKTIMRWKRKTASVSD